MKILQENKPVEILDLGVVSAGEVKQFEFQVNNDGRGYLRELVFKVDHPEVKISKAPVNLDPNETQSLIVEWAPSIDLEEGLKVKILIEGKKIIKPV